MASGVNPLTLAPDAETTAEAVGNQGLNIDFDELLRDDADEPTAKIVVVSASDRRHRRKKAKETDSSSNVDESLSQKSDGELKEQIHRFRTTIPLLSRTLPDKGEKLKLQLNRLEAELHRRSLRKTIEVADECKNLGDGHQKFNGETDRLKRPTHSSQTSECSVFGNLFREKLKNGEKSNSEQNIGVRGRNAFQDEMSYMSTGEKRKRNAGGNLPSSKKAKTAFNSKDFSPWKPSNGYRKRQNGRSDGYLRPLSQEKLCGSFTGKNGAKELDSKTANDEEECTVVLVDEEEPEIAEKIQEVERRRSRRNDCKIFYPSREDPESLEIFRSELKCLEPGECLTSTIMNFYIRFLQQLYSTSDQSKHKFYFFNTYFYNKLQEAVVRQNKETFFIKFRRWWKGVNIFEKTYIFLPINEDKHWSLLIVCISNEEDSGLVMLHLDSLGLHSSRSIFKNVKSLLESEWRYLKEDGGSVDTLIPDTMKTNLLERISSKTIEAPRQTNDYDCGLFVLYYIERFIQDAPEKMKEEHFSEFGKKWFKAQDASSLRGRIKNILLEEFQKAPAEDNPLWEPVHLLPVTKTAKVPNNVDSS